MLPLIGALGTLGRMAMTGGRALAGLGTRAAANPLSMGAATVMAAKEPVLSAASAIGKYGKFAVKHPKLATKGLGAAAKRGAGAAGLAAGAMGIPHAMRAAGAYAKAHPWQMAGAGTLGALALMAPRSTGGNDANAALAHTALADAVNKTTRPSQTLAGMDPMKIREQLNAQAMTEAAKILHAAANEGLGVAGTYGQLMQNTAIGQELAIKGIQDLNQKINAAEAQGKMYGFEPGAFSTYFNALQQPGMAATKAFPAFLDANINAALAPVQAENDTVRARAALMQALGSREADMSRATFNYARSGLLPYDYYNQMLGNVIAASGTMQGYSNPFLQNALTAAIANAPLPPGLPSTGALSLLAQQPEE